MKIIQLLRRGFVLSLMALSVLAHAEDIDIYTGTSRGGTPSLLFILDNAANFSANAAGDSCTYVGLTGAEAIPSLSGSAGGVEQCALYNVISSIPENGLHVGFMGYNATGLRDYKGENCNSADGGCLMVPIGTPKADILAWIRGWQFSTIKATGEATAAVMQEAWAYYSGRVGLSQRDYRLIQPTAGCQKNFVVFIGNAFNDSGKPNDSGTVSPKDALVAAGATLLQQSPIQIPSTSYGSRSFSCGTYTMGNHVDKLGGLYADEWSRFMYNTDIYSSKDGLQSIITYTVGVLAPTCKPEYPALLTSMAKYGGGKYFGTQNSAEVQAAILKIINEVQASNSAFSSASLPVSVNAQGTYLNQIFLGMFRPDPLGNPRWLGNLKQYQFILEYPDPNKPDPNKATLRLGDANGDPAISTSGTGFISASAVSFWTKKDVTAHPDDTGGFFINDVSDTKGPYDSPDGELVERGGAAQVLRKSILDVDYAATPASPRKLYVYCPSGACNNDLTHSDNAFATSNDAITDALLGAGATSAAVTSISRNGGVVTVETSTAHGFSTGDAITITGANQSEYNGLHDMITKVDATHFTFLIDVNPPTVATGTYTASLPGNPQTVISLTRSGTIATVRTSGNHGYVTGQQVTISGANQSYYNGNFVATVTGADTFTYVVGEYPPVLGGSGIVSKVDPATGLETPVANSPNYILPVDTKTPSISGVIRTTTNSGRTVVVQMTASHGLAQGDLVTLAGVVDAAGNKIPEYANTRFKVTAVGGTGKTINQFAFDLPNTEPTSPATGTIVTDVSLPKDIDRLGRSSTTATVTTKVDHGFVVNQTITINSSGTAVANEAAYTGQHKITSVIDRYTFTYSVVESPVTPATGSNIRAQKAGMSDRVSLINWVRGHDNYGDERSPGSGYTVRPSVHGDVVHSRPVVVNYDNSKMVVFYGGNDGVFRAVNGSQTGSIGTVPPGGELWGLLLPEHLSKLNRQRVNTPELKLASTLLATARPKDYFVDGSPGLFQQLKPDGTVDKAYIYLNMRRGGQFIYALDVSIPESPRVLWRKSNSSAGFGELGQTWSRPRITLVNGYVDSTTGKPKPVIVFGAGYDAAAEDAEPPTASTMGRGIFVVDAVTGDLVWSAKYTSVAGSPSCSGTPVVCSVPGMNWSIPADITFVDRDNDGRTDRFYAADVGGNVWRIDLEPTAGAAPINWQVSKLAALGCGLGPCASGVTPRKFFYPPNVVSVGVTGGAASYDAVMLGSGDREHPLITQAAYNVVNRFYVLKDKNTGKQVSPGSTIITEAQLSDATSTAYVDDASKSGFYHTLATGEKVVNASVTTRGTTYFGTNEPKVQGENSCATNLGSAKGYALSPFTGSYVTTEYDGGGLPPSPITGIVNITVGTETIQKEFCVGCAGGTGGDSKSPLGAGDLTMKVPKNLRRTYWYKK